MSSAFPRCQALQFLWAFVLHPLARAGKHRLVQNESQGAGRGGAATPRSWKIPQLEGPTKVGDGVLAGVYPGDPLGLPWGILRWILRGIFRWNLEPQPISAPGWNLRVPGPQAQNAKNETPPP